MSCASSCPTAAPTARRRRTGCTTACATGCRTPGSSWTSTGFPYGVDFVDQIRRETAMCDVVLVMIGDNWLDARPGTDVRRIDEPEDFVRLEIESALASPDVRTLPVLVENARCRARPSSPRASRGWRGSTPSSSNDLRWRADLDRLVDVVEAIGREKGKVATPTRPAPAPAPAPAPERAPVLLADPGHAGRSHPEPRGPARRRSPSCSWSCPSSPSGFGAWVPALWAGLKRPPGDPVRRAALRPFRRPRRWRSSRRSC